MADHNVKLDYTIACPVAKDGHTHLLILKVTTSGIRPGETWVEDSLWPLVIRCPLENKEFGTTVVLETSSGEMVRDVEIGIVGKSSFHKIDV